MLFFDIETEGLPLETLQEKLGPFDQGSVKGLVTGEFDPDSVKTGNLGAVKAEEKIAAARRKHSEALANSAKLIAEAEQAHWDGIVERAALSATTGKVLVIGFYDFETEAVTALAENPNNNDEAAVLRSFWKIFSDSAKTNKRMVGLNIFSFDLPFLIRRSWILEVEVPPAVGTLGKYVKWNEVFTDLREIWQLGDRQSKSSFDELGRAFGTGGKPDGINGGDFARLWREDRETAKRYLINDLKQPVQWALRMGI